MDKSKSKNSNIVFIMPFFVGVVCMFSIAGWLAAIITLVILYFIHTLFLADHLYYSVKTDYQFNFKNSFEVAFELKDDAIFFNENFSNRIDTCFLPLKIQAKWIGYFLDPYIEITIDAVSRRQYFERGANGTRYINISPYLSSLPNNNQLAIRFFACEGTSISKHAIAFNNEQLKDKSVLIISPHADDAELAAFGFYKNQKNVSIATITAGESEADRYFSITKSKSEAGILKGKLRAWDSIVVPKWAGKHIQAINLGYACSSLKEMFLHQKSIIKSRITDESNTNLYRQFNDCLLPTSNNPVNQWGNLVQDLVYLLERDKPQIVITPHPLLDSHSDHQYSTRAVLEACDQIEITPTFLCYANHYQTTDQYPFGPEHTDIPLPPHFSSEKIADSILSYELSKADQIDKICALQMMHDLQRPIKLKRKIRVYLQQLIGRSSYPYGQDEYFRKAIRTQEIFWVMQINDLWDLTNDLSAANR